jgi:hypothetical protein
MIPTLDRQTNSAALTIVVCAIVLLTAVCPAHAATARDPKFQPNLEATVRYLQNVQHEEGGFAEPGTEPGSDFTAWVTLAIAAAGINPRDQTTAKQHWLAGHSAYSYLAENAHNASLTTDFERELLVVDAAGTSPHDFGGVDLAGEILKRQIATGPNAGAFPHEASDPRTPGVNDTIFAILALSPIREPAVEEAIARATQWLEAQQKCDGSWNWNYTPRAKPCNPRERRLLPGEEKGEIDMTGAALEALNAVKHPDPKGQEQAFAYLREGETPNGGFPEYLGESEPNVASTAWVVQAMWSAGINPEAWTMKSGLGSDEPLSYMSLMQQPDGHIRYRASQEINGMWMTAYVTPAFTGNPLPIPALPPESLPSSPPEAPTAGGDGGVSERPGGGVIAGGGGNGAPLFSRPQPKSKGHTPGGGDQLNKSQKHGSRDHKRNPGPARKKIASTIKGADVADAKLGGSSKAKSYSSSNANRGQGSGTGLAGSGSSGNGGVPLPGAVAGMPTQAAGEIEVKGVLIGNPKTTESDQLEAGAPGLRSAGAGRDQEQWLTSAICVTIALLILAGALIEYRRPQVTL